MLWILATSLGLAALGGCGSDSRIKTERLYFEVDPNANADNAVKVDLVLVYDATLIPAFAAMAAGDWFKNRSQLLLANPTGMEVKPFEVIPGQRGPEYEIEGRGADALGAFVFARYASPGPHRARIDGLSDVLLKLGEKDFTVAVRTS